jgi:phosphoenolpyruvate-protein kinase (PTS system EI component)
LAKKPETARRSLVFYGVPAAPGVGVGRARRMAEVVTAVEERRIPASEVEAEIREFRRALERARAEISELREATLQDLGETQAKIFDVQIEVLNDPLAVDRTVDAIRAEGKNAAFLFRRHMLRISTTSNAACCGTCWASRRKTRCRRSAGCCWPGRSLPPTRCSSTSRR